MQNSGVASPKKWGVQICCCCCMVSSKMLQLTIYMHGTPAPPPPLYIKHFSTDLRKSQEGSEQKWGGGGSGPMHPFPCVDATVQEEGYKRTHGVDKQCSIMNYSYSCFPSSHLWRTTYRLTWENNLLAFIIITLRASASRSLLQMLEPIVVRC